MLIQSLTTRSVHFAFLFGPPRVVGRQEASAIYDKICEFLKLDDFAFKYENAKESETPQSLGFRVQLERKEGRGGFKVSVDNPSIQQPIRLLVEYEWPPSLEHVCERCDLACAGVFQALTGTWQKVYAELRLRAHCADKSKDALGFVQGRLLRVPADWANSLGSPLGFAACKFATSGGPSSDPLESPARELSIEVLMEDRSRLYFELVSKWTRVPNTSALGPSEDVSSLRAFTAAPSEYVRSEHEFLRDRLTDLSGRLA